ncbi:MAG: hypothetical protein AB7L90_01590 [Hyphomicrobiaceae bacterium]
MTDGNRQSAPAHAVSKQSGLDGWVEAALFSLALAVLNVSYGFGQQYGVHPVALLFWAMPAAAAALLAASGTGPDWRAILRHPLSLVVGGGIIAMEAVYYVLLGYVNPTDGSILVRLSVPIAILLGYVIAGRRPARLAIAGGLVTLGTIVWYTARVDTTAPITALAFGATCGMIMSGRSFAAEKHPWNRAARTIREKMRMTGLVLGLASAVGIAALAAAMAAAVSGILSAPPWLPRADQIFDGTAVLVGLFAGTLVLTAMQYLAFSVVLKLGSERFIATGALTPVTTLLVQSLAVVTGLLQPIAIEWGVLSAIAGLIAGVVLIIASRPPAHNARPNGRTYVG